MKLIFAIVNNDDAHTVNSVLRKFGYFVTKISSTGGFLMNGNSTFITGVKDEEVDHAIELIGKHSKKRVQPVPVDMSYNLASLGSYPAEVTVGGATIFVLNIEKYERV
ncbi:MAG: cyclic-di-AMP receptor [Oscillospiraceae bacterium]|nr:cyclic-di-AMP receptor [Oscillospiraceae bacterium]